MKLNYRSLILIICFFSIATCYLNSQNGQMPYRAHTVSKGETIYSIAKAYNVSVYEVYKLNPHTERGVRQNEILRIPPVEEIKTQQTEQPYVLHSIQSKETLFSVSKRYNVTVDDILAVNEGLSSENFRIGHVVRIPVVSGNSTATKPINSVSTDNSIIHKVQAKETLFGISKQYNVTKEQIAEKNPELRESGLKKGMTLLIPLPVKNGDANSLAKENIANIEPNLLYQMTSGKQVGVVRIGLFLPFLDEPSFQQARFIEYYEGILLAVEEMKANGHSINLYSFDIRRGKDLKKLESLLDTYEVANLDLIIGGVSDDEILLLSEFTKENNIGYVVPFPVRNKSVVKNPNAFQSNVSPTDLYSKVSNNFIKRFNDSNVIILVDDNKDYNDKKDFTDILDGNLTRWAMPKQTIIVDGKIVSNLKSALSLSKKNVIVPSSSSLMTLSKIMPTIRAIKTQDPSIDISLFGYPDWQTYSTQFLADFFNYDTYIFSSFFVDNNDMKARQFAEKFESWYGKTMINTYPKYGILGYDTGLYFISALTTGKKLVRENLANHKVANIQSTFNFNDHNPEGIINTGLYFVHYRQDMTIEKIDYSK